MLNKVQLIGFLGGDPDLRYTTGENQKAVIKFSLATSESWKKDGEKQEKTEWHNIVIYGKLAEVASDYLKKGSLVYLEGAIKTRSWEKDGVTHYIAEIVVDSMKMLPNGKAETARKTTPAPASALNGKKPARKPIEAGPF